MRALLRRVGLLDAARELRDSIVSLTWLRSNVGFWLHGSGDGLPVPPLRLVRLTTGASSLAWSFHSGSLAAASITDALERNRIDIAGFRAILDFGCGCGRVVRHWTGLSADVHGCDYNPALVRWCRQHLRFARFDVNALHPPLPYRDQSFDFVYALSVFTHLPGPLLQPWMREMYRILRPGGLLLITTHGEAYVDGLTPDEQQQFRADRLVVKGADAAGTNRCGVYFSEAYVRSELSRDFHVVDFVPSGAAGNPHQDLVLLQKPQ